MAENRLERLRELPLRGFDEMSGHFTFPHASCTDYDSRDDDTPSSGTASLPTPQLNADELHTNQVTLMYVSVYIGAPLAYDSATEIRPH